MEKPPEKKCNDRSYKTSHKEKRIEMRLAEQEVLQNGKRVEIEDQSHKKIYHTKLL